MATSANSDTVNQESGSTAFFDNICQPCENDGKILEAEGRCEDCNEYLCKPCFISHTVPSITRHHVMIGKEQLDRTLDRKDQCIQKCSQHDDEIIKYYCPTHSFLGCSACMILGHTSCSGTIYIPEAAKAILNSEEYKNFKASKSSIETTSLEIRTDAEEKIDTFNKCQTSAVTKLRGFKKEMIDLFEKAETKLIEESENAKEEEHKKQESTIDKTVFLEKELRALTSTVERFESLKQYCNMYISLMKTKEGIQACEHKLGEIDLRNEPQREIIFLPNHIVAEIMSSRGMGMIKDEITQVKHERDINVKTDSDTKTCWISGSVMLPDNKLVIIDHQNDKLKMIDIMHYKVVEELSIMSGPWNVTSTGSNEVAVTLSFHKKIAFVNTDDKLVNHRSIDVDGACSGIACMENTLVITFDDRLNVEVIDMEGVVLRTIATDTKREAELKEPLCVVASSVNKTIYISDNKCSKVVCLTSDGTLNSTYTDAALGKPTGMAVDSSGTVYVCDWNNHTIHQITQDCKKKRILLTEKDVTQPYTISYCENEDKFYIGMRDNDIVKVFKVV